MDKNKRFISVYEGDRISVRTLRERGGNLIGRLPDGRVVLFGRDSPYLAMLAPGVAMVALGASVTWTGLGPLMAVSFGQATRPSWS